MTDHASLGSSLPLHQSFRNKSIEISSKIKLVPDSNCIFCKIIDSQIPCTKVYEDDAVFAFRDINPESPEHILVIPKIHKASLNEFSKGDENILGNLLVAVKQIAEELGFAQKGYRTVINTGDDGGQTVHHLHLHLLAGRKHSWPAG